MITEFKLNNFRAIQDIHCTRLGNINLFVGMNGTGKTTILESLYVATQVLDNDYGLNLELKNIFEVEHLSSLIYHKKSHLNFEMLINNDKLSYKIGKKSEIYNYHRNLYPWMGSSFYISFKDCPSLNILSDDKRLVDLNKYSEQVLWLRERKELSDFRWLFRAYSLQTNSIVFIDEIESGLHPTVLIKLIDYITVLAKEGVQFFITTNSYYVIKKMRLVLLTNKDLKITLTEKKDGKWYQPDEYLGESQLIDVSIELYKEEMFLP